VWTETGREALFVADTPGGAIIRPAISFDGGRFDSYGTPEVCQGGLFAKPPTEKISGEAAALARQRDRVLEELRGAEAEMAQARAGLERLSRRHAALAGVAAYLDGRATHVALLDSFRAFPIEGAAARGGSVRLLTLRVHGGGLSLDAGEYSDCTGGWQRAALASGEEEAENMLAAHIKAGLEKAAQGGGGYSPELDRLIEAAAERGMPVPAALRDGYIGLREGAARRALERHAALAAEAQKGMGDAEQALRGLEGMARRMAVCAGGGR
jgi:hypothetical protein